MYYLSFLLTISLLMNVIFLMGVLVGLERKMLGLSGSSMGPYKMGFKSLYLFLLDFIKLAFKHKSHKGGNMSILSIEILLLVLSILSTCLMLPIGVVGSGISYGHLIILVLGVFTTLLKILVISGFGSEFLSVLGFSMMEVFVGVEVLLLTTLNFYVMILVIVGENLWLSFDKIFVGVSLFGMTPLIIVFFMTILVKTSSSPFDYLESESEFVGGGSIEFYGLFFVLWSLMEYGVLMQGVLLLMFLTISPFIGDGGVFMTPLMSILTLFSSVVFSSLAYKSVSSLLLKLFLTLVIVVLIFMMVVILDVKCCKTI